MKKRLLSLALVTILLLSLTACGGSGSGNTTVTFMYGGNVAMAEMYSKLIEEFNKTVGKKEGITVKGVPKSGSLDTVAGQQLPSNSGPDLISLSDEYFKKYAQYLEDLTGKIDESIIQDFYPELRNRYRYDIKTTTSNEDDPLYGLPAYNDTTILYYNKTVLEAVGVICISVAEEELADFNAGKIKDDNGKTKADYGIEIDVPAKGYYRSDSPYVPEEGETDGSSWVAPSSDDILIFNDKIAMNWDEIEDLGMLCTKTINSDSPSQYGYYTEWWFNYGWSVGGNCLEDLSGEGNWKYTLAASNPNYIVGEGKTYTGVYTGTVYNAGDTLDVKDIVNAKQGDTISYKTDEETYFEYTVNGEGATYRDFSAEITNGTLTELPSTVEAFSRFCYLAGVGGLNVCPYPSAFNGTSSVNYFTSGTLALLVEQISNVDTITKTMADEWGIAPLPQYKVYTNPTDPACDTVEKEGKMSTHSVGYSISISAKSEVKDQAAVFVNWLATDGQKTLAENGYISSRISDAKTVIENLEYKNPSVVMESISVAQAGDWWYMPDRSWISYWASPLNNQVRYGKMELEEFLYGYIEGSNELLEDYKQ